MNRVQLVQVIIIVAVIVIGYEIISSFSTFIERIVHEWPAESSWQSNFPLHINNTYTLLPGLMSLWYTIILVLLLRFAYKITLFVIDKVKVDESLQLGFSDKSVIYATMLFLTFGYIIKYAPDTVIQSVVMIRENLVDRSEDHATWRPEIDVYTVLNQLVGLIICTVLLIRIKAFVNFFHNKIDSKDPNMITITGNDEK